MRHRASLLASMEGISRPAFLMAKELSQNSRSGLTPRFLAKKFEMSIEEVEYLVDVHHKLLYTDLTKIKLAPEGFQAVKRVLEGLESHGDVSALDRRLRVLPDLDLQRMEERVGLEAPTKKALFNEVFVQVYQYPDTVMNYVASREFSARAREVFDILWQSHDGILTITQLYAAHGASEFGIEQALWELLQSCVCFELFRFDSEDRLVRAVALLKELRDFRKTQQEESPEAQNPLLAKQEAVERIQAESLVFSETVCRLTAAIAAHVVRLRNDGELFREDRRRLETIRTDEDEPSLNTCLWAAEGLGWLARVDNTLRAGNVNDIIDMHRVQRHRKLYEWLIGQGDDAPLRGFMENALAEVKPGMWYSLVAFIQYAKTLLDQADVPELKRIGAHYEYVSPSAMGRIESRLMRLLEETLCWLGVIERGECEGEACFRISTLGEAMLSGREPQALLDAYSARACTLVVQPNYEVVTAVQDMDPLLTIPLETFAKRISDGQVLVYQLTREHFVRALQEGRSAESFFSFLLKYSRDPLPENVLVTLRGWCGTTKKLRLRVYHVIETDDPLVAAELAHSRRWQDHVASIDEQKVLRYHDISKAKLKRALEKDGYIVR